MALMVLSSKRLNYITNKTNFPETNQHYITKFTTLPDSLKYVGLMEAHHENKIE